MEGISLVTLIIIGINALISYIGFNNHDFFDKYKFKVGDIKKGDKIRVLSSGFLHVNWTHLFVNMLTLYFFADVVIDTLNAVNFVIIYLGSLVLGNLFSLYFHKDEPHYTAVGASGAVMGILYSAILLYPNMMLGVFFIIPMPAWVFGIGYLLYSLYGMKKQIGNIGHDAHFGGAMGGYFLTLLLMPSLLMGNLTMVIILAIPLVILFIAQKTGKL